MNKVLVLLLLLEFSLLRINNSKHYKAKDHVLIVSHLLKTSKPLDMVYIPLIPALQRYKLVDLCEFQASLNYVVRPYLKK